ncbi:2-polyprenyl-6-methoxyphenol hydroxylase [Taibaiella sp. KBW10]|uniref:FAD-dependent oxidoreductase n=1 Tax=Taibaiella sp. KBW10 TaxID=2153357 RepID=UPI000F5A56D2|nr:NAD(P)/FAD-dependent oxidoreductase [Taibaiella sp. KBW10]RQO31488.1 2-polyprenyl-6-methoxyphenol hydroxylase [Taibaiella sp. KBW10]
MLVENISIAIVGGGPGGLTLARLLQQKGAHVKVYERDFDKDVRMQGATLDLHFESGLKAIEATGLTDAFKERYRPGAEKGRLLDKHTHILYDEHDKEGAKDFGHELFRPEIDRSDLRALLLNSLQPDTLVWDSHVLSLSRQGAQWKLVFKNGTTATADLVIGADGASSKLRPLVTDAAPFYAGNTILQGNVADAEMKIPGMFQLLKGGKIYAHSDGKYFHVSQKGDGSIDFYISGIMDENWAKNAVVDFSDQSQIMTWVREAFAGWDSLWYTLFEKAGLPILVRPQYCMPFDQTWAAQPNITLLGDAAHIMPPSGEGVNLAMLDALELSECLTNDAYENIRMAIAAYEEPMRIRAAAEARDSLDMVAWMHAEGAQEKMMYFFSQTH